MKDHPERFYWRCRNCGGTKVLPDEPADPCVCHANCWDKVPGKRPCPAYRGKSHANPLDEFCVLEEGHTGPHSGDQGTTWRVHDRRVNSKKFVMGEPVLQDPDTLVRYNFKLCGAVHETGDRCKLPVGHKCHHAGKKGYVWRDGEENLKGPVTEPST